uniref:Uncharacterized protein n=1 Tax=Lepeophtheirus salmonis TaxID=72036 RepID=A0A0K2VF48_LEPSM
MLSNMNFFSVCSEGQSANNCIKQFSIVLASSIEEYTS